MLGSNINVIVGTVHFSLVTLIRPQKRYRKSTYLDASHTWVRKYQALSLYSKDRVKNQLGNFTGWSIIISVFWTTNFTKTLALQIFNFHQEKSLWVRFIIRTENLKGTSKNNPKFNLFKSWFLFGVSLMSAQLSGCICMMNMVKSGCKAGGTCKKQWCQIIYEVAFQSTVKY